MAAVLRLWNLRTTDTDASGSTHMCKANSGGSMYADSAGA